MGFVTTFLKKLMYFELYADFYSKIYVNNDFNVILVNDHVYNKRWHSNTLGNVFMNEINCIGIDIRRDIGDIIKNISLKSEVFSWISIYNFLDKILSQEYSGIILMFCEFDLLWV